ncbi:hypothetical protein CPLU01_08663 [Colletotrichum plurivorum]|uniref:Uncharacterized protein n=1 Tax=Colletotrichum plurivorum TaxID=2175906 RepID=A0A8H6NCF0_9PEZI|nr:hypothetical protein CPLU01_08663 [Colletotrichum plurivorum]
MVVGLWSGLSSLGDRVEVFSSRGGTENIPRRLASQRAVSIVEPPASLKNERRMHRPRYSAQDPDLRPAELNGRPFISGR